MKIKELKNKKIAILWFGKEWQSSLQFLIKNKISLENITLIDKNPIIENENIKKMTWDSYLKKLNQFDIIIKTPWISLYEKDIYKFKDKITSQIQIFLDNYESQVILVSWTKWKSTTSTIIYQTLLEAWFDTKLVWNIGKPVLSEIDINSNKKHDFVVFETSSYMLENLKKNNYISVLLNIFPDHLNWHNWFENYKNAKLNILNWSKNNIINHKLKNYVNKLENANFFWNGSNCYYEWWNFVLNNKVIFGDDEINLIGDHNKTNICAIIQVCKIIWIDMNVLRSVLKKFKWLPHRLEYLWEFKWIWFWDDAISTTPESTIEAIKSLGDKIDTIFLGGENRWYNFKTLIEYIKKYNIKNIVLFPDSWKEIKKLLNQKTNIFETSRMEEAVKFAYKNTSKNNYCLLSCASPSYSLWKNYEEKGNLFQKFVKEYI